MEKKHKSKRPGKKVSSTLKNQVEKALGPGGKGAMWIRDDGAVCFGDECVVFSQRKSGGIDISIDPTTCGGQFGEALVDKFTKGVGRDVNLRIKRLAEDD